MSDPSFTSFSFFPLLPPAVRALILHHACPPPRTRFLELYAFSAPTYTPRVRYIPPLPALFHVSRETRAFGIAHAGTGTLAHFFTAPQPAGKMFYIDFARDVIFLSSRWVLGGPSWQPSDKGRLVLRSRSTETGRLRELNSLLGPRFLGRVRRIVVTVSGKDEYEGIAGVLREYSGLERLYLAVRDDWSGDMGTGRWPVGYAAWKLERSIKDEEAGEDEDEDDIEDGEKSQERRLKVLECDLSLNEGLGVS